MEDDISPKDWEKTMDWVKNTAGDIYESHGLSRNTTSMIVCFGCNCLVRCDEEGNLYCNCHDERPQHVRMHQ